MFKNIKLLKKLREDSYKIEYENDYITENDEAIIYVKSNEKSDIINKYSDGEDLTLNSELSSYIQQDNPYMDLTKPIVVKFNSEKEYSKEDKKEIKQAYRNYFMKKVSDINEELYDNFNKNIWLFIVSAIFLMLYILYRIIDNIGFGSELILIISWVFVWNLTESLVFTRPKLTRQAIKLYKLLNARIEFYN